MFEIKDSGVREVMPTGSQRDTREGKGRFDLLSPIALRRLAQHTEAGAKKYEERNWEKGQPVARYIDSTIRHVIDYMEGKRDEDHLAAGFWNLMCAIHTEEMVKRGEYSEDLTYPVSYIPDEIPDDVDDDEARCMYERSTSDCEVVPCDNPDCPCCYTFYIDKEGDMALRVKGGIVEARWTRQPDKWEVQNCDSISDSLRWGGYRKISYDELPAFPEEIVDGDLLQTSDSEVL